MSISSYLNDWLSYGTNKVVTIRNWRVGLLHYSLIAAIVGYIIYNMISQGTYMIKSSPSSGSIRSQISFPLNVSSMPVPEYCTDSWVDGCLFWTPEQIIVQESNTFFITTRVTFTEALSPYASNSSCSNTTTGGTSQLCAFVPLTELVSSRSYYIANVDTLTLQLSHAVRTSYPTSFGTYQFDIIPQSKMQGRLLAGCDGSESNALLNFDSNYRQGQTSSSDSFSLATLLKASNCDQSSIFGLNNLSRSDEAKPMEPLRYSGFAISLPVWYNNPTDPNKVTYKYIPAAILESRNEIRQTRRNKDGSITYISRYGIRINMAQVGIIGRFDFFTFVLNLVAALGLIAVSSTMVEILILYVLPRRDIYNTVKYEQTIDLDGDVPKITDSIHGINQIGEQKHVITDKTAYVNHVYYPVEPNVTGGIQVVQGPAQYPTIGTTVVPTYVVASALYDPRIYPSS